MSPVKYSRSTLRLRRVLQLSRFRMRARWIDILDPKGLLQLVTSTKLHTRYVQYMAAVRLTWNSRSLVFVMPRLTLLILFQGTNGNASGSSAT